MRSKSVSGLSSHTITKLLASNAICISALCLSHNNVVAAEGPGITPANSPETAPATSTKVAPAPGQEPLPVPAAPPSITAPALPQGEAVIDVKFKNAQVSEIVQMIAEQSDVQIIITGDVNEKVGYINLVNVTPEKAIEQVATSANLQWRKVQDKTYIIAKVLPPDLKEAVGPQSKTYGGIDTPSPFNSNTNKATIYLPPNLDQLPTLVRPTEQEDNENEPITYRYIPVKKVSPRWIGWWIDPAHNPKPIEVVQSEESLKMMFEQSTAKAALDPSVIAAMNGSSAYSRPAFNSPYAPAGSLGHENRNGGVTGGGYGQFVEPYTRSNAQFGFDGGGGGRNNRGGGGRNNRNSGLGGGNQRGGGGSQGGQGGGLFELPEGIESIVAVDPQNALLVKGTAAGIAQIEEIIGFLDIPLRQVEIEAQFVDVAVTDAKAFGIDFSSSNGPFNVNVAGQAQQQQAGSLSVGFVRNNFRATLNSLISNNRAKVVTAPRVTAINNLTASLVSSVQTPLILNSSNTGIGGQVGQQQNLIYIPAQTFLLVTPTINNDGTVTVRMTPNISSTSAPAAGQAPIISNQSINTTAIVRDGDTIALGGLRSKSISTGGTRIPVLSRLPLIGKLFQTNNATDLERELIIFMTARIVHRAADEDLAVPNT